MAEPRETQTRRSVRTAASAIGLFACLGCVQGPDYQRPAVEIPAAYRFAENPLASSVLAASPAWWNAFADPILDGLIRECVASNRDLRIATARVDEFEALLVGTRAQGMPQVGYGIDASRQRSNDRISSTYSTLLSAGWEIDLWGRIRRESEAARANLLSSEEARRGVILTLVASVIIGYVTLLDLDRRLEVAQATVAGRQESVSLFRMRLDGGVISDFEMSQVLAEYESAVAAIPDLKTAIAQQEHALSVLLGRNPGSIQRGRKLEGLGTPAVPGGLPAELLGRRPDIAQAEQQLVASNALIGAARALYFPRISLTGLGGFVSSALSGLFTGPAATWSFAGSIAGPIFTGGSLAAATGQAEARREQALAAYELVIQNAFGEVEDALVAVRSSRELEATLERRVETLKRGVALARDRYDNGYADYIDVLDTERSLFSAELSLTAARGDRHRALVNLYRALGGDWIDHADGMAVAERGLSSIPERQP